MQKTKVLAIAPYDGLREVIITEAASRDDVEVDVYMGDLADGAAIAKTLENSGYDIILSRGGTATLIEHAVNLPVVDITPSVYDLLRFIRMAENIPGRFAVVGFFSITHIAEKLFDLIQHKIEIVTLQEQADADVVVKRLIDEGFTLIVGDAIAVSTAKKLRINSILIASGIESVQAALTEAVRLKQVISTAMQQNLLYRDILDKSDLSVMAFGADKKMLYSNLSQDQLEYQRVFCSLSEYVPAALKEGEFHITRRSKGYLFEITGIKSQQVIGECVIFYIRRRVSLPQIKAGVVEYYHMLDANREDEGFLPIDNIGKMASVLESAQSFGKSSSSVVVAGENGAHFNAIIHTLYNESPLSAYPLIVIDCALIDGKSFCWILDNEDSPLCEARMTICFKNFSSLDEELQLRFIQYAECTSLSKRNRLIFCVHTPLKLCDAVTHFFNDLECLMLRIPSLSERTQDIASLANLYLSILNIELGRQVIGFDEDAIELLSVYHWPGSNDQLRRFVKQCLLRSKAETISASIVEAGIVEEKRLCEADPITSTCMDGTLEEINAQIVKAVLKSEDMNRQKTAERLGISRSTLWRMLKYQKK